MTRRRIVKEKVFVRTEEEGEASEETRESVLPEWLLACKDLDVSDAYAGLSEFAAGMDFELARMVLDSEKDYKLPAEDKARFDRIRERLSELDWEGIRGILNDVL